MEKYKVLEHTADVLIEAYGEILPILFINAAIGMCEQVIEKNVFEEDRHGFIVRTDLIKIKFTSPDLESELHYFLTELRDSLYYEGMYPVEYGVTEDSIRVTFNALDRDKTVFCDEIKAITYHEMKIKIDENGMWKTKVLFDV